MANEFKVRKGLIVNGSGSVLLDIQGSQGQLFSVTDQLSGSLFSVSDISGIPVMEAFSDNVVKIGRYGFEAIKVSGSVASVTGSFSGSLVGSSTSASFASTSSFANTFNVAGTITAQTLVVQTITSSVDFVTGSTRFGSVIGNTHVFTGSMAVSGGLVVTTTAPELTVNATGVTLGNVITDTHNITGSVNISGSAIFLSTVQANGAFRQFAGTGYFADFAYNGTTYNFGSSETTDNVDFKIAGGGSFTSGGNFRWFTQTGGATPIEALKITPSGNLEIGTSSKASFSYLALINDANTNGGVIAIARTAGQFLTAAGAGDMIIGNSTGENILFGNGQTGTTEYMRVVSTGNLLVGTTTDSGARITGRHTSSGNPVISATNNSAANSRCYYGQKYSGSTDDYYMIFDNATDNKFLFYGNGGLGNVQANNVNISDERTKKDIIPLESYWNKLKAIEIVKFKYKDQNHNDYNIGVIAQQVELVAPEFIDVEDWGKDTPAQTEEPLKSVYTTDLYHATIKVLQEAMAKIETLETEINELKAR